MVLHFICKGARDICVRPRFYLLFFPALLAYLSSPLSLTIFSVPSLFSCSPLFYQSLSLSVGFSPADAFLLVCLSVSLSVCLSVCLSVYLSVCLSVCLSVNRSVFMSVFMYVCEPPILCICVCLCVRYAASQIGIAIAAFPRAAMGTKL